jgi:hypothetical protein
MDLEKLKARSEVLSGTFKFIVSVSISMSHNLAGKGIVIDPRSDVFSFEIYKRCLLGVKALWLQFDYPMEQCLIFF